MRGSRSDSGPWPAGALASSCATRSVRVSCTKSATRSVGRPCCAEPKKSPGPRVSRSYFATARPSDVRHRNCSRSRTASLPLSEIRMQQESAAPPHAPAQLVQCRQAEPLGILNDHDRRVRHVNADLDDCRRDKHVQLTGLESLHDIVPFPLASACRAAGRCAGWAAVRRRSRCSKMVVTACKIAHGFVFLDGRADDVDLMPRRDLLVQKAVHVAALFAGDEPRFDGLAARRQLVRTEISRSPYMSSPSVRGMGVALMTSRCGLCALPANRPRCRTPKRCCSSTMARPRF